MAGHWREYCWYMQQLKMLREQVMDMREDAILTLAVCLLDTKSQTFLIPVLTGPRAQI